jgi:hypothetical protein
MRTRSCVLFKMGYPNQKFQATSRCFEPLEAWIRRTSDLKTQLLCAELALSVYTGPAHLAEAHDLAATIGQTLDQSGPRAPILEYRVNVWLGNVVGLAGGGRWDAAPR